MVMKRDARGRRRRPLFTRALGPIYGTQTGPRNRGVCPEKTRILSHKATGGALRRPKQRVILNFIALQCPFPSFLASPN